MQQIGRPMQHRLQVLRDERQDSTRAAARATAQIGECRVPSRPRRVSQKRRKVVMSHLQVLAAPSAVEEEAEVTSTVDEEEEGNLEDEEARDLTVLPGEEAALMELGDLSAEEEAEQAVGMRVRAKLPESQTMQQWTSQNLRLLPLQQKELLLPRLMSYRWKGKAFCAQRQRALHNGNSSSTLRMPLSSSDAMLANAVDQWGR